MPPAANATGDQGARRSLTAISVLALVGGLFVWRYSARVVCFSGAVAVLYSLALVAIVARLRQVDFASLRLTRSARAYAAAVVLLTTAAVLVVTLTPEENRVARLPALAAWISAVEAGAFPWAEHVNAPSSFPFMYVLAWPFDLVGNLGFLEVIGIAVLGAVLWYGSVSTDTRWLRLATVLLLPPLYYEPIVRSELLFNAVLAIVLILVAERWLDPSRFDSRAAILAVAFGLILSTRAVVALVWAAYLAYRFRGELRRGIAFAAVTIVVFWLTLLPFVVWDAGDFFANGPFTSQSRGSELPTWIAGVALLASAVAGLTAPTLTSVLFRVGLVLFAVVLAALVPQLIDDGDAAVLSEANYDLGYFVICVPFLILAISSARERLPARSSS